MSKQSVTEAEVSIVQSWLRRRPQCNHIRVRTRGELLILESGPEDHRIPHARLRRVSARLWMLEMPHRSRWQSTPYTESSPEPLLDLIRDTFGWMLMPLE